MAKYDNTCWTCKYLECSSDWRNDSVNGSRREIRCGKLFYGVDPYSEPCCRYDNAHYSDSFIERCIDAFDKKCNYYIVSACCAIASPLNCDWQYLEYFSQMAFVKLKNPIVIKSLSRFGIDANSLLDDYSIYGKFVANNLWRCYNDLETRDETISFVKDTIIPKFNKLVEEIQKGKDELVILRYILLVRDLMQKFGIPYENKTSKLTLKSSKI